MTTYPSLPCSFPVPASGNHALLAGAAPRRALRAPRAARRSLVFAFALVGLLPSLALAASPAAATSTEDPLATTAEMREWSERNVPRRGDELTRLRRLLKELGDDGRRAIAYDLEGPTLGAAQAFAARRADCLSFALLVAALARAEGIPVGFALELGTGDVRRRAGLSIDRQHIVVTYADRVFDRGRERRFSPARHRPVSERTAIALFHSNRGVQSLAAGGSHEAVESLYHALRFDPSLTIVWTNLGVALRRTGDADAAAQAHEMALRLDPADPVSRHNLSARAEWRPVGVAPVARQK